MPAFYGRGVVFVKPPAVSCTIPGVIVHNFILQSVKSFFNTFITPSDVELLTIPVIPVGYIIMIHWIFILKCIVNQWKKPGWPGVLGIFLSGFPAVFRAFWKNHFSFSKPVCFIKYVLDYIRNCISNKSEADGLKYITPVIAEQWPGKRKVYVWKQYFEKT